MGLFQLSNVRTHFKTHRGVINKLWGCDELSANADTFQAGPEFV